MLRLLGPSAPAGGHFKAREELVWEYRFCDDWGEAARLDVRFDATRSVVRAVYQRRENTRRRTVCSR